MLTRPRALLIAALLLLTAAWQARPQTQVAGAVTSPQAQFGHAIGDDYFLATFAQLDAYWTRLDRESDRMQLVDIGRTEEGRTQRMAVISAPENLQALDRYRTISARLARADGLTDEMARALAAEGRAVVWIDGGLHADEVLGSQQLIQLVYEMLSRSDEETLRILHNVILLAVHANPDGHALVADWYMREPEPHLRRVEGFPRLYQKYAGHDNNRDFYLSSQAETINMNRVLYREWFPQIVLNHHQTSPPGTVMFAPPFRDPFNYVFDPLVPVGIDLVGAAMHARFAAEGKAGVTMRSGSNYSTWWNGGLRTTAYFHNQIGLLTETFGSPTPTAIPFVPARQLPSADLPFPIAPQRWHFRQSVDYAMTANRAVLDIAARFREAFLFNVYRMGRNAIERGSRDTWTITPRRLERLQGAGRPASARATDASLRDRRDRDPRGYVLPADQPDFPTTVKFVDALLKAGVTVHQAAAPFTIGARTYPAASFVVFTAQAFRPHVLDMFEPQDHPDDIPFPGAAPTPPYDSAGWTLAYQMGVKFDRILDPFTGPFETVAAVHPPAGEVTGPASSTGYLVSHHQNDAFVAVNRLLAAGERVYWLTDRRVGGGEGTGAIYIAAGSRTRDRLADAAQDLGLTFTGVAAPPAGDALALKPARVGLWDRYGGASSSGWARWLLERYGFGHELVFPRELDAGRLVDRFDVIILPDEAVPARSDGAPPLERVPPEYRGALGTLSWERTLPALQAFVEAGGTLITIGRATAFALRMGVPVSSALTTADTSGRERPLAASEFYVPGSVLRVAVDNTTPLGFGFEREVDVFFDRSPAFRLAPDAAARGVRRVAWFESATPLRSGWAWGQQHLEGAAAIVEAPLGKGRVLLFGPEVIYRAQPHGTFKFLFNGIHRAAATPARP